MLKYLKISASALVLGAFVLAPATMVVTADYAVAKSDNGGGKGNGGGNGGGKGNGGGNKGGDKGGKGGDKGNAKSAKANGSKGNAAKNGNRRTIQDDFKSLSRNIKQNGLKGLFGKQNKTKRAAVASKPAKAATASKSAPKKSASLKSDPLHPSNLGKMNGAINSSPNAKAAHIANGNFNGPVGLAAALALADYELAQDQKAFATATETLALQGAFNTLADESLPTPQDAETLLAEEAEVPGTYTPEEVAAAQQVQDAVAATEGAEQPTEEAVAAATTTVEEGPPSEDGVTAAEVAVLGTYKGTLADEDKDTVLDTVRASLPDDGAIAAAVEKNAAKDDEETAEGDMTDDDDDDIDQDQAMTDDEIIENQG